MLRLRIKPVIFFAAALVVHGLLFWQFKRGTAQDAHAGALASGAAITVVQLITPARQSSVAQPAMPHAAALPATAPIAHSIAEPPSPLDNFDGAGLPHYYQAGELTKLPEPVGEIDLSSTAEPGMAGAPLNLIIYINDRGRVMAVAPEDAGLAGLPFVQAVEERFRAARFVPGEVDGRAVWSALRITVVAEDGAPA